MALGRYGVVRNNWYHLELQSVSGPGTPWIPDPSDPDNPTPPATVEVIDNGQGISKETEAKLFSPFFSTKPNGQGIGLIFIREVLMRHGCTFSLRTYADGLTRFRITFP